MWPDTCPESSNIVPTVINLPLCVRLGDGGLWGTHPGRLSERAGIPVDGMITQSPKVILPWQFIELVDGRKGECRTLHSAQICL